MSVTKSTKFICDECGAIANAPNEYSSPSDPWITIRVSGGWVTDYGTAIKTELDACGPACAVKVFEKAKQRAQRVIERFPSANRVE